MNKNIPKFVKNVCHNYNVWIVGSAAAPGVDFETFCGDIDLIVSFSDWENVACMISPTFNPVMNAFGGWKFYDGRFVIDIWPGDLSILLKGRPAKWIWNCSTNQRYGLVV